MRVYRVSPILEYSPFYKLTYFSKLDFTVGNVVEIDFNKRKIFAIIVEVLEMDDAKVEIRSGSFKTKKIEKKLDKNIENFLNKKQFLEIQNFSEEFLLSIGEVFSGLFNDLFTLENSEENKNKKLENFEELIIFPDILSKKVRGGISGKEIFQILENLRKNNILKNIKKIIIKEFNLEKYWSYRPPHISQMHLLFLYLKLFSSEFKGKIVLENNFLGICEDFFLKNLSKNNNLNNNLNVELSANENKVKKFIYKNNLENEKDEKVLNKEILDTIKKQKTFIFVLAGGFASKIYCKDCGENYKCENLKDNCKGDFSILNEDATRYLFCKTCKFKKILKEDQYLICKKCGGWGLFPYGQGSQKIYQELLDNNFKKEEIVFIDESEKKLSDKKIIQQIQDFYFSKKEMGNKILLGSKRVLKVLLSLQNEKLQTIVLSLGPLIRSQFFDADEKFIELLSSLENVSKEIYIAKNQGDEFLLENFKNKEKFLKEEMKLREDFSLPPFAKILSFNFKYENKKSVDIYLRKNLEKYFFKKTEIKKGRNIIYYWILKPEEIKEQRIFLENLRNFGEIVVSNFIYSQFY